MPKNKKNRTAKSGSSRASESFAMHSLVIGCVAEFYLFIVRRYANGTANQMILWNERYFPILAGIGAALLAIGAIWVGVQRDDHFKRMMGVYLAAAGIFIAVVSILGIWNLTFLDFLVVIVPIAAFLGIVWGLYDKECALSLTTLGLGVVSTWVFSRTMQPFSPYLYASRGLAALLLTGLAVMLFMLWSGKLTKFLSRKADPLLLYVSLALTFAGILACLVSVGTASFAMWILAMAMFGLLVYYTVQQI